MNLQFTERCAKEYERLPRRLQRRVTLHYRLIFTIEDDSYILLRVGTHDLLKVTRASHD